MTYALEVSGLFEHRDAGEQAAQALRAKGYSDVEVMPVNDRSMNLTHLRQHERWIRFGLKVLSIPVGFVLGALCATPLAYIFSTTFAWPMAVVCGLIGVILCFAWVNYRFGEQHHSKESVIVTACCALNERKEIVHTLHEVHADKIVVNNLSEADYHYE